MYIKWIGHSCFKIISKNQSVVIDPYEPNSVPGYKDVNETANMVYCSHEHKDHNYKAGVIIKPVGEQEIMVTKIKCFHDECNGNKRGLNTIHIFEYNGVKIVHLGDLGHPISEEMAYKLKDTDCLLIPVGGYYTIDNNVAYDIVQKVKPKIVVPMHYRDQTSGYEVLDTVDAFLKHFKDEQIIKMNCNTLTVDQAYNGKVVVLSHQ